MRWSIALRMGNECNSIFNRNRIQLWLQSGTFCKAIAIEINVHITSHHITSTWNEWCHLKNFELKSSAWTIAYVIDFSDTICNLSSHSYDYCCFFSFSLAHPIVEIPYPYHLHPNSCKLTTCIQCPTHTHTHSIQTQLANDNGLRRIGQSIQLKIALSLCIFVKSIHSMRYRLIRTSLHFQFTRPFILRLSIYHHHHAYTMYLYQDKMKRKSNI